MSPWQRPIMRQPFTAQMKAHAHPQGIASIVPNLSGKGGKADTEHVLISKGARRPLRKFADEGREMGYGQQIGAEKKEQRAARGRGEHKGDERGFETVYHANGRDPACSMRCQSAMEPEVVLESERRGR